MAITTVNTAKSRCDATNARILIKNGTDYISISNLRPNSWFEYTPGLREILHETNVGDLTTPQNGDAKPTQLRIKVWGTASVGSTQVEQWFSTIDNSPADGNRKLHDIYIEIPNFAGASAGKLYRFRYCAVKAEGGISVKAGSSFDEFDLDLTDFEAAPTISAYVAPLS
jgi:hypothetical protein